MLVHDQYIYPEKPDCDDDIVVFHSGFSSTMANYSHGKDTRDYYLIHWVTRGRGTYQTETAKYNLKEGDGFLILPGQTIVHTADKEEPWDRMGAHKTVILKITIMASVRQGWERNNGYLVKAGYSLFFCRHEKQ